MKNKKFKLFASLTSLVMVVAVMAVGVWAATSASVGITGKISYAVTSQVKAEIKIGNLTTTGTYTLGNVNTEVQGSGNYDDVTFDGSEATDDQANVGALSLVAAGDALSVTRTNYTGATAATMSFEIVVTNKAPTTAEKNDLTVSITMNAAEIDGTYSYTTESTDVTKSGKAFTGTLDANESVTIVVTVSFDLDKALTVIDLGAAISLTAEV